MTPLPTPPSSSDPANFNSRADAFLAALPQFVTEANALGTPGLGGGSMTAALNFAPPVTVASAATCDIGAAASNFVTISGTVSVTSLGTTKNALKIVTYSGAVPLVNSANLLLLGAANKTVVAGDVSIFQSDNTATPIWREVAYTRLSAIVTATGSNVTVNASGVNVCSISVPVGKWKISATVSYTGSGATGAIGAAFCIGTTSGSFTGSVSGFDKSSFTIAAASAMGGGSIPGVTITPTVLTTYYLVAAFLGSTSDTISGTIRAEPIV